MDLNGEPKLPTLPGSSEADYPWSGVQVSLENHSSYQGHGRFQLECQNTIKTCQQYNDKCQDHLTKIFKSH